MPRTRILSEQLAEVSFPTFLNCRAAGFLLLRLTAPILRNLWLSLGFHVGPKPIGRPLAAHFCLDRRGANA
jgi:hypothetical protein